MSANCLGTRQRNHSRTCPELRSRLGPSPISVFMKAIGDDYGSCGWKRATEHWAFSLAKASKTSIFLPSAQIPPARSRRGSPKSTSIAVLASGYLCLSTADVSRATARGWRVLELIQNRHARARPAIHLTAAPLGMKKPLEMKKDGLPGLRPTMTEKYVD